MTFPVCAVFSYHLHKWGWVTRRHLALPHSQQKQRIPPCLAKLRGILAQGRAAFFFSSYYITLWDLTGWSCVSFSMKGSKKAVPNVCNTNITSHSLSPTWPNPFPLTPPLAAQCLLHDPISLYFHSLLLVVCFPIWVYQVSTLFILRQLSGWFLQAILTGRTEALWELESANHTEWSTTTSIVLRADNDSHKERQAEEDGENSWNGKFIEC